MDKNKNMPQNHRDGTTNDKHDNDSNKTKESPAVCETPMQILMKIRPMEYDALHFSDIILHTNFLLRFFHLCDWPMFSHSNVVTNINNQCQAMFHKTLRVICWCFLFFLIFGVCSDKCQETS